MKAHPWKKPSSMHQLLEQLQPLKHLFPPKIDIFHIQQIKETRMKTFSLNQEKKHCYEKTIDPIITLLFSQLHFQYLYTEYRNDQSVKRVSMHKY